MGGKRIKCPGCASRLARNGQRFAAARAFNSLTRQLRLHSHSFPAVARNLDRRTSPRRVVTCGDCQRISTAGTFDSFTTVIIGSPKGLTTLALNFDCHHGPVAKSEIVFANAILILQSQQINWLPLSKWQRLDRLLSAYSTTSIATTNYSFSPQPQVLTDQPLTSPDTHLRPVNRSIWSANCFQLAA